MTPEVVPTELHRHLDVSLRTSTVLQLAQERGLESQSTSLERFAEKLILRKPLQDLGTVLATFTLFQKIFDRPEIFERAGFEVVEDCWNEGTRQVELRFSPAFVTELNSLAWEEVLDGFERGIQRALRTYPGMKAGLICIVSREYGIEGAEKTVEFFLRNQNHFIGLDLAGNEAVHPNQLFEAPFQAALRQGAKITVHSGEASGPENVWQAIQCLGARRIGHGVRSIQDPALVQYLANHQICLEICPTSNWLTQAVSSLESHPLPQFLRAGVPVCINTDDPGIFGVGLPHEVNVCIQKMGLTPSEAAETFEHATKHSFL